MSQDARKDISKPTQRRVFFGQLIAAFGGGILGGSLLRGILGGRRLASPEEKKHVRISANPLAVPRTKEGSKSNV